MTIQETILDSQPLWMKKELKPTSKQWRANDYGIKITAERYVGNVTAI